MRLQTIESNIELVKQYKETGQWVVRWDFKPMKDELGNDTGIYWYEEEIFNYIPSISDIQQVIINWLNKQTDGRIKYGFTWKGIEVYLSDENKFNYKAIIDEVEISPDLLPVTLKLGKTNEPENFYTFTTLEELREFFSAGVRHLINAYGSGWNKIASFDWAPYEDALKELDN